MLRFLFICIISSEVFAQDSIPFKIKGHLSSSLNNETSGIAASFINKGFLFVNNDSGDSSRFFMIDTLGELKSIYRFTGVADNGKGVIDCEDLATGTGPVAGKRYIYIGDIGDNLAIRKFITVYRTEEPILNSSGNHVDVSPLHLKYPDGPRDAETLMIDPVERLLYIISKREDSVGVYTTPLIYIDGDTVVLTKRCTLYFEGFFLAKQITAGDISQDGKQVILKSYSKVYYWKRKEKQPVWKLLKSLPRELPYKIEKQGESIAFVTSGKGYYVVSEGLYQTLYYYNISTPL